MCHSLPQLAESTKLKSDTTVSWDLCSIFKITYMYTHQSIYPTSQPPEENLALSLIHI